MKLLRNGNVSFEQNKIMIFFDTNLILFLIHLHINYSMMLSSILFNHSQNTILSAFSTNCKLASKHNKHWILWNLIFFAHEFIFCKEFIHLFFTRIKWSVVCSDHPFLNSSFAELPFSMRWNSNSQLWF